LRTLGGMNQEQAIAQTGRILDAWLPLRMAYGRVPGLSVGIVSRGRLRYARGFGFADVASRTPVTPQTCFRIASNSKTFTGVAIMQLVEAGSVRLDDTIASHLRWFRPAGAEPSPVTIRQTLSHTAGVFRDSTTPHWHTGDFPDLTELRRSARSKAVVFENLTRFKYSNFGFALLGEVIKKASGMSYASYMRTHILEPLGLERTEPDLTAESRAWLAAGYSRPIPEVDVRETFPHSKAKAYASATGFLSNVPDLARYIGALSLDDDTILGRGSKKEMFRPHWPTGEAGNSYGLGFAVYDMGKRTAVGHGGGYPGFITNQAFSPTDDLGVIVLTNTNDSPAESLRRGIFATIDRLTSDAGTYRGKESAASLRPYEGTYRSTWADMCVIRVGSSLVAFPPNVDAPLSAATVLRRAGKHSFVLDSQFNFDSTGERATFTVASDGSPATRMKWGANPFARLEGSGATSR
jgi:D-alanyl-D-alanine carboxypeptidase